MDSRLPTGWGVCFFDYDLDGRLDLFMSNGTFEYTRVQTNFLPEHSALLFWNSGPTEEGVFWRVDESLVGEDLLRPVLGRGAAYADIDGDGDLDLFVTTNMSRAHLFRNDGGSGNLPKQCPFRRDCP